jgi:hypothetical protein
VGVALSVLLPNAGCTLLTFSSLGSIAELGNSAVSVGSDKFYFGKLTTAENTDAKTALDAALAAGVDLGLTLKAPDTEKNGDINLAFLDEHHMQIGVEIDRRTAKMVRIKVDVGLFGNEVSARLFLARMRVHLPHPNDPHVITTTRPAAQ